MTGPITSASRRGRVIAWLTLLVCLALHSATAFGQWRMTGHEPQEPPYTTINETNQRGETRETRYTRDNDGRVTRMVQTTKDKKGRIISIVNEWYDDHGNLIGGFRQQFGYDPPYRQDQHYVPPKGKENGGWENVSSSTSTVTGLVTADLVTPRGHIKVNLPDDLAAGDTISGTVILDAAGQSPKDQAKNQDELKGYVVEVEDQKTRSGQGWGKWIIPAAATAIALVVRDHRGREVARDAVPVEVFRPSGAEETERPIETVGPTRPDLAHVQPSDYQLPRLGQVGKPAIIRGPFGGDSMATSVKIGGQPVQILAESPRQVVALNPTESFGPTQIEVRENNVVARGYYRNISVSLAAGKTVLHHGERTPLTMTLRGFQGIEKPVRLRLSNHSPEVVSMEGGDVQIIEVAPEMIATDGTYVKIIPLIGLQPGSFSVGVALSNNTLDAIGDVEGNDERNIPDEIGDGLPFPTTPTDRRRLIENWHKAWEAKKAAEAAKKAADDAQKAADEAKKAADDAQRTVEREPRAPDIQDLKKDAAAKKAEADTKQTEADTKKATADTAQAAAATAQDAVDKSKVPVGERGDLYKQEADRLDEEAKAAQAAADRTKAKIDAEGDPNGKLKPYADGNQKEANDKKQQADALKKAAASTPPR